MRLFFGLFGWFLTQNGVVSKSFHFDFLIAIELDFGITRSINADVCIDVDAAIGIAFGQQFGILQDKIVRGK